MEKFAVDLDKVLDEFEFNEDHAEQMAAAVAKRTSAAVPPVVAGTVLYQPAVSCYRRPAFEAINLADADFTSDSHTSTHRYNNGFSSATNSSLGRPTVDGNCHLSHSDHVNRGNEIRVRNDTSAATDWPQNFTSVFCNRGRTEVNELGQRNNLPTQNTNYCDEIHVHRNTDHTDFHWQQVAIHSGSDTSTTNKLNVSGVFSSLNEYLNAGKIETEFDDVNIISNQASWNLSRRCPPETEENGNYAVNYTDASAVLGTEGNYEHGSSVLYPLINAVSDMQVQALGGQNVSDDFQENSHSDDVRLTSDQWESTGDICIKSESDTQSSFADLIPVTYSGSMQEEANISGLSMIGINAGPDETSDLLDTTICSNTSDDSFNKSKSLDAQIKDGLHFGIVNSGTSKSLFSGVATSRSDLQNYFSKDKQSNLTLLPDVATPGKNVPSTSYMVVSASSDLVTSHVSGVLSNIEQSNFNKTALDCANNKMEVNENLVTSPSLDSSKINSTEGSLKCDTVKPSVSSANSVERTENVSADVSQVCKNEDFAFTKTVTNQLHVSLPVSTELESSLCSNILFDEGNSEVQESGGAGNISKNLIPVGFSVVEVLDDAELHQYLQELEDNDKESEIDQRDAMECKVKTGISSSLQCQDSSVSDSEVGSNKELPLGICKAEGRRHDENLKSLSSRSREIMGVETETVIKGDLRDDFRGGKSDRTCSTALPEYSSSDESSAHCQHVSCMNYSPDNGSKNVTTESVPSVVDEHTENGELLITPGSPSVEKPRTVPVRSVLSSTAKVDASTIPVATANIRVSGEPDSDPQAVQTMSNATPVTSKTSSIITNVVSIDCQKITQSSDEDGPGNGRYLTNSSESSKRVEDIREGFEIKKPETENLNLVATEMKSADCLERVLDSEKMASSRNNSSLNQETNFDLDESCLDTPEVILPSNETDSCENLPDELVPFSENEIPHPSTVDNTTKRDISREHSDKKNDDVLGVSEIGFSEVQSCLVQMPRDGTRINVLGEEERPSRPKYLFLPSKITVDNEQEDSENSEESPPMTGAVGPPGETPSVEAEADCSETTDVIPLSSPDISESSSIEQALSPVPSLQIATPLSDDMPDMLSPEERCLGKLPPFWVPDADAPNCMQCEIKFTVLKRRHHCRACGKVLCSKCCSMKSRLEYMDNSEARVCQPCYITLAKVFLIEQGESASGSPSSLHEEVEDAGNTPVGRQPNPNNPMEYCSTIPPLEQAASVLRQPPPSVLVPVGVLKREGSTRSRSDVAKQVIFSDGIRPGGDLTELDGSSESRLPSRRPGRVLKRVGTPPGPPSSASSHSSQRFLPPLDPKTMSYIPADKGLPPLAVINKGEVRFDDVVDHNKQMAVLRSETEPPTVFAINRNLFVQTKILNLDCCVNRTCWCFSTFGMSCVGQDEIVIILECLPDEATVPKDVFKHLNTLYQDASRGNTVSELGYTVFQGAPFLDSAEHGGFIYIRPSFQCLQKLILPSAPYLVAVLVHRWETPWATVFPIRLMLRLGAEYRYYPCMLVSIRNRKPVYWEIGHTIINLLADFRNMSYTLPSVRGLVIHMEDRQTSVLLPKNRYDQVTRALSNSNDHVLALASNFSFTADSHLVCIQSNRDESYHTQAINIHNKPRKVTGASFVVFNGALKTSSNLTAKSSIVEDGLMVQITPDTMQALRGALRNMQDFCVGCGPTGASQPDELVNLKWVEDDRHFNVGVKSSIDGRALDGVPSIRVHNGTDYLGSCRFIRWTEVFILQSDEGSGRSGDPLDISRVSESLARATCMALIKLLDLLAQAGLTKVAVRATVHPENVGYEAGSKGEKLPPIYMDSLDNELVPVLHKAASMSQDSSAVVLELIFYVMLQ